MVEWALYTNRNIIKVDEERDSKYSAFRRYDVKHWKRWRLYLGCPMVFPRFFISLIS